MANKNQKKRRKQRWLWLRYRKNDPAHNVQVAVQRWIHANDGTAVVIGGIGILDEEDKIFGHNKGKYQVCIGCIGIIPKKKEKKEKP